VETSKLVAGRFEVVRELGAGAAGQLLLVRDGQRDGAQVALKILRPRERDPGLIPLFRREFLLLSAIDHPCVVSVRDFGVLESGEPWFSMDYIEGENVRPFVAEERLDPMDYVDLAAGLLGALARVHAQGVVHCDIKPENIILRRSNEQLEPVLVDFGLAISDAAGTGGEISGTPPYIAPEVLAGADPDGRADLFSLGMVLYELCVGSFPGSQADMLRDPTRIFAPDRLRRALGSRARGSVPKKFEDFVARLLAGSPHARYPTAAAALDALASTYEADIELVPDDVRLPPPNVEPPFVGRTAALDALLQRIEAMCAGKLLEPTVVVAGRAGSGVTRLLRAARYQAAVKGCDVYAAKTLLALFREIGVGGDSAEPTNGARLTPAELVFRIDAHFDAVQLRAPPVLILDEIDRMDEPEVAAVRNWVAALEHREGRARLLLVLGGATDGEGAAAVFLRTAGRAVPVELRDLAPFTEADIRAALSILLGGMRIPPNVTRTLHRASDGNPRVFAELLRLLLRDGVIEFHGETPALHAERLREAELPDSVLEVARARGESLSEDARAALRRLALFPGPLPFEAARVAAGDAIEELLGQGIVTRDDGRIRFSYEVARRAHDTLAGEERRAAQLEIGGAVEKSHPDVAAYLLAGTERRADARILGLGAAETMIRTGRVADAKRLLLAIGGEEPDEATAQLYLRALISTGSRREAAEFGYRMLGVFESTSIALATATALAKTTQFEEALDLIDRYIPDAEGLVAARLHNARAALLRDLARFEEALEASARAEQLAGGVLGIGGRVAETRGRILRMMRRNAAAAALYSAVLDSGKAASVASGLQTVRTNRAYVYLLQGDAFRAFSELRVVSRARLGERPGASEADAWRGMGEVLVSFGRAGRALTLFERARTTMQAAASMVDVCWCLAWESYCLLCLGRPAEGESRLARARAMVGADADFSLAALISLMGSRFLLCAGRPEEARHALGDLPEHPDARADWATMQACIVDVDGSPALREEAWREALGHAFQARNRMLLAEIRVRLAQVAGARGAWHLAEQLLARAKGQWFSFKTPVRARSLLLRAMAALNRDETATAGRLLEDAVAVANRNDDAPLHAAVYSSAASLLEEPAMQRYLRKPTAGAAAALLETARETWTVFGNDTMLHKIDLHLSELPRPEGSLGSGPEADRLVKVLHVARELNREFDRDKLLSLILDRAIELTGAERGFVILLADGREEVRIARNIDREAIAEPEQKVSSQVIREVIETGRIVRSEDAALDTHFADSLSVRQLRLKSIMAVPFRSASRTVGALYLDNRFRAGNFTDKEERLLELFADQAVAAIARADLVRELEAKSAELKSIHRRQQKEIKEKGRQLQSSRLENRKHRRDRGYGFELVVAKSVVMQAVVREAKRLAASDLAILVTGESGTGKEMIARAIHYASPRQSMEFVSVSCAAFPEGQLESELFGHVRGSFGASDRDRAGLFEQANGGTLFLDEIGDMSLPMQVKMLRALELGEVRRLGDDTLRTADVRVIAATHGDLDELVRMGRFREDLKYRLVGSMLALPSLRERLEDLESLTLAFIDEATRLGGSEPVEISDEALARLETHPWPGNVRELRNVVMRSVVSAEGEAIEADDIVFDLRGSSLLPGFDPSQAERIVEELSSRGIELNRRQQQAIARSLTRGKLSFAEYVKYYRVSKSTTSRDLDALQKLDLLEKRGKTRATVYLPGPKLREIAKRIGLR